MYGRMHINYNKCMTNTYIPNWAYRQEVLACSNLQSHHDMLLVARMLPAFFYQQSLIVARYQYVSTASSNNNNTLCWLIQISVDQTKRCQYRQCGHSVFIDKSREFDGRARLLRPRQTNQPSHQDHLIDIQRSI